MQDTGCSGPWPPNTTATLILRCSFSAFPPPLVRNRVRRQSHAITLWLGRTRGKQLRRLADPDLSPRYSGHHLGDRHLDATLASEFKDRLRRLHALGDLRRTGRGGVEGQATAQVLAERAVAGLRGAAGGDQVVHASQPREGVLVRAKRRAQPGDLGQA